MAQVVKWFISFSFLLQSMSALAVSNKRKWRSFGDLVWPWHCWQLAFRSQCKGLQKVAIVPSGNFILLFMCFEDIKSLFCFINYC